ncbi:MULTISPECIES: Crp/Fnr family transcriptional regulator [unclassified Mesorhizobium]|uniref:Crp/Fnr family transcriptional regulator n=1 Tax=unclassified Mesorhizobium TaxID=325217 RepID=UPI000F763A8C|nr:MULTISPECIES: Crp/Fnr family transcriptional regulator [unclassified Mesorhizobium]AZO18408.1 Crp/Fnr family transcriptional regulator [Mesorhizobium sp. M2A.F.Ca.ET.043.05.1.1]RWD74236.1 MAG: cyclic nucleotide-binding domain-containing protein [Mesorhizobium sp.]RWE75740.1 MAG: cyclic nucleotide-binding domain-containing protein [Mesorhizobium sp.]TIV32164.1 MAG: Crp/Fnr family transcriptional regulator [Mesorhizobium sp.]TIV59501.1 MAG: Crp/Fnr family transcriptional regulator [Mesorhizob
MSSQSARPIASRQYRCEKCPLRPLPAFREFDKQELSFISTFKRGELAVDKGATVLVEGSHSAHLYTVLSGWAFRYKLLPDGRRQILNFSMPGDLIGLQGSLMGEMQHSVEALSPMLLCVFEREQLQELYRNHPGLAYDITWIASREERMLDENLLSIGRRTALERAAYLIAFIASRARGAGLNGKTPVQIPITQQHVADTLGLSLVHTNKTIRKLMDRKLVLWRDGGCEVIDYDGLKKLARWEGLGEDRRPLI